MVLPDDPPGTCTPCTEEARLRARVFLVDADIPFRATDPQPAVVRVGDGCALSFPPRFVFEPLVGLAPVPDTLSVDVMAPLPEVRGC